MSCCLSALRPTSIRGVKGQSFYGEEPLKLAEVVRSGGAKVVLAGRDLLLLSQTFLQPSDYLSCVNRRSRTGRFAPAS